MANISKTRTLFGFTSPRTLEKVIPEIGLLSERFAGQVWDKETQKEFFESLTESDFYEGTRQVKNPDMAARDRITRAPKSLGLVQLKPSISLTAAGRSLLNQPRSYDLFTRQLMKFQLPSPYHPFKPEAGFRIRPYLELVRLVRDAGSLSKTEIALFFVPLNNVTDYPTALGALLNYRKAKKKLSNGRKAYTQSEFDRVLTKLYKLEIQAGDFGTRESKTSTLQGFLRKKQRNLLDYADAFLRYLRATQLVTLEKSTMRLVISDSRRAEAEFLLSSVPREPASFAILRAFEDYLFSPDNLPLLTDDVKRLTQKLATLGITPPNGATSTELQDLLEQGTVQQQNKAVEAIEQGLKHYQRFEEVDGFFDRITKRGELQDAPMWLEWNVWRSFTMMNYAKHVTGNFTVDLDGAPLGTAAGNQPDLELDYGGFQLIVEVTLSTAQKQYEMEGEPVARHYSRATQMAGKPVYCIFVAPAPHPATVAHFFNLNKSHTDFYGGQTNIIPLSLRQFRKLVNRAKEGAFTEPAKLEALLKSLLAEGRTCQGENRWLQAIETQVSQWLA